MKMTMRWFGDGDSVSLEHIAQVPCVRGIVGTLEGMHVDQVWTVETLLAYKSKVESLGLSLDVIESIPVAEAIKLGLPERDHLIDIYCESVRNMGRADIPVLCYNFMPVLDWMRTDMHYVLPDGSVVTGYNNEAMQIFDLSQGLKTRVAWAKGYSGEELQAVIKQYEAIDDNALFENLAYFLRRVVPVAEESGVLMAIHPDDPPWSILGLPRIVRDAASIQRILEITESRHNGLTFCTGSLGVWEANDLCAMVRQFASRIHFVHLRNIRRTGKQDFFEVAHPSENGNVDMAAVIRTLIDIGYSGPIRSDHGRLIWNENVPRTGYGLYDRALGGMYIYGIWQGIEEERKMHTQP